MMTHKRRLLTYILIAVLAFASGYLYQNTFQQHHNPHPEANVYVFRESPQGIEQIFSGNTITDIGERYARNQFGFENITNFNATQWISLGNSSIAQTKTKLDTEATTTGFTRAANDTAVAWISSGDYAYNITKKFTATGTININATGLQWSGTSNTDNNLFALASLGGSQTFQNNWNCTIVWVITWNAN